MGATMAPPLKALGSYRGAATDQFTMQWYDCAGLAELLRAVQKKLEELYARL